MTSIQLEMLPIESVIEVLSVLAFICLAFLFMGGLLLFAWIADNDTSPEKRIQQTKARARIAMDKRSRRFLNDLYQTVEQAKREQL